ncbi:antitoxin Xre/MbcA/ParS toxin-binding domain-containing protein [Pulveribacter sp.]|uniref:antitoxin Xre/MbcA/ParS toxin-binding domain-containing protein n=1 Tax=Pulveribacter sp. TaxID=2678893 RepID=UPI0028A79B7B|nr:antitoxin Xre/MbcA/ParS toxin-binding domain-containing protein [Pulveribacter sp.]
MAKRNPSNSRASRYPMAVFAWPTSLRSSGRSPSQHERLFVDAYKTPLFDLVEMVKLGIPAEVIAQLAEHMRIPPKRLTDTLGLSQASVQRKVAQQRSLTTSESSRVLGLVRMIGQVQLMVHESGEPEPFDAAAWLAGWLEQVLPALGGRTPAEFMDTAEGQAMVAQLLAQAHSGAYA